MDAITPAQLRKLIEELDIDSPIRSITTEGDTIVIRTAWETFEIARACGARGERSRTKQRQTTTPTPSPGHDDTLPKPAAASGPPTDDLDFTDAPEPLSTSGLDDFTAIDGVGPVTAQKLHDLELYTYDDLRSLFARLSSAQTLELGIQDRTRAQIEQWLAKYLV